MVVSEYELDVFHRSVDTMSARLAEGERWNAVTGLGTVAAAVSRMDSPPHGYDLVDIRSDQLGLSPEDAFPAWQKLAFLGDEEALDRARSIGGVVGASELELAPGVDIEDIDVGGRLIGLAAAGDPAAFPLVQAHILALRDNPEMIYDRTRRTELLYRAGDPEAVDLAVATVHDARAHALKDPSDAQYGYRRIDTSLWGLGSRMIARRQVTRLGEITALIGDPATQAQVLSSLYASGQDPTGESAERVINIFNITGAETVRAARHAREALNTLVVGGYEPVIDAYRELFIESPAEFDGENSTVAVKSLIALAKAGISGAEARLLEYANSSDPDYALISLLDIGHHNYVYERASQLFGERPSRFLLKTMLLTKFTTQQWTRLWDLPIGGLVDERAGGDIYYRANDILMLAEHLTDSEIHLERHD